MNQYYRHFFTSKMEDAVDDKAIMAKPMISYMDMMRAMSDLSYKIFENIKNVLDK